jgi:hypothetical protein
VLSALLVAGCGESGGVSAGATVAAYVEAPLCAGAKRELASRGGRAGEVRVRVICLAGADRGGRLDLATVGANARRASEDSATVGYIEAPVSPSFSRPIVEAADIAVVRDGSGAVAMSRLLGAIQAAGESGALRGSVRESLG